jgi:branched-chain amino acid transport system permease protein
LNVDVPVIFGYEINTPQRYLLLTLAVLCLTTIIAHNVSRSRLGRAFIAIRDNDLAAELLGINLFKVKLQAFFLAAVFAGLAGALAAHQLRHINSESFNLTDSIIFMGMLVIGGLGSNLGPIFGAIVVEVLIEVATLLGPLFSGILPATAYGAVQALRPLFFGAALMLFLIFEPRGLAYRWQLVKAAWRLRPFSH